MSGTLPPMAGSLDRIDYFAVSNVLPWLPEEPIGSFRRAHYPTAHLIGPHLTVVFPVPASIGSDVFREHVRGVVSRTPAFDIRLRGLGRSWDHWLFLGVARGGDEVIALHDALYTGILREHLWTEQPYVPHVGLGLFVEERDSHDLLELRPRSLDRARFEEALHEAEALGLDYAGRVDSVHILGLDEDLTHVTRLEEIPLA
jgi:2'-5' RNA ligase